MLPSRCLFISQPKGTNDIYCSNSLWSRCRGLHLLRPWISPPLALPPPSSMKNNQGEAHTHTHIRRKKRFEMYNTCSPGISMSQTDVQHTWLHAFSVKRIHDKFTASSRSGDDIYWLWGMISTQQAEEGEGMLCIGNRIDLYRHCLPPTYSPLNHTFQHLPSLPYLGHMPLWVTMTAAKPWIKALYYYFLDLITNPQRLIGLYQNISPIRSTSSDDRSTHHPHKMAVSPRGSATTS